MYCRICGEQVVQEVFLDQYGRKTKNPACLRCYERLIINTNFENKPNLNRSIRHRYVGTSQIEYDGEWADLS